MAPNILGLSIMLPNFSVENISIGWLEESFTSTAVTPEKVNQKLIQK